MKKITLLAVVLFLLSFSKGYSQVTYNINIPDLEVPALVFSEFRVDVPGRMYVEVSNVGTTPIDLGAYVIVSCDNYSGFGEVTDEIFTLRNDWFERLPLTGTLAAGESYVVTYAYDNKKFNGMVDPNGYPAHNIKIVQDADVVMHAADKSATEYLNRPEWEAYDFDSISNCLDDVDLFTGYMLQYKFPVAATDSVVAGFDSTIVDLANIYRSTPTFQGTNPSPIAGVKEAVSTSIMVRKASVKAPNVNWDNSIGTDATDSEWMLIPISMSKYNLYTTVGAHGDFDLQFASNRPDIIANPITKELTLPWEMVRSEDLIDYFTVGDGMAWAYSAKGDLSYSTVQEGDAFVFYATGDELKTQEMTVKVSAAKANLAVAYSRRHKVMVEKDKGMSGIEVFETWPEIYSIVQGSSATSQGYINNVPFACRKDSLLANLIIPEKALFEFTFVGGDERVDLQQGDKLTIYSEDFSAEKSYVVNMDAYASSDNSYLNNITWPDVDLDTYEGIWEDVNMPNFSPLKLTYFVLLAPSETVVPALQFVPQDINASVNVRQATDPDGTLEQRTTRVEVTAEDGITTTAYEIIFTKVTSPSQPYLAEPFISEIGTCLQSAGFIEIFNPGTEPLDLGRYMIVRGTAFDNLKTAVEHYWHPDFGHPISYSMHSRYKTHYVPGMKFKHDTFTEWDLEPGYLEPENSTVSTIVQPGDVFAIGSLSDGAWPGGRLEARYMPDYHPELDICLRGFTNQVSSTLEDSLNIPYNLNPVGDVLHRDNIMYMVLGAGDGEHSARANSLFLLRVDNDSVLEGTKMVTDPNDYTIVDRFQKSYEMDSFLCGGKEVGGGVWMTREPHVFQGVTEAGEGFGDNNGRSTTNVDWTKTTELELNDPNYPPDAYGYNISGAMRIGEHVGWHVMNQYTGYLSSVSSSFFDVTPGYEGDLTISGDLTSETVNSFSTKLVKNNEGQSFVYFRGSNELAGTDNLVADDVLQVYSKDSSNVTMYTLKQKALSGDNTLTAKSGGAITITGTKVSGFASDATLSSVMADVVSPDLAVMKVLDANQVLVPFAYIDMDGEARDVLVSPAYTIEVTAPNGAVASYTFDFGTGASDAILFSQELTIDQDDKVVMGVLIGASAPSLKAMLYANTGASVKIVDKAGFERTQGKLMADDEVLVTSQDATVKVAYTINFVAPITAIEDVKEAVKKADELLLYPNPTAGVLNFKNVEAASVKVYDLDGRQLINTTVVGNQINVSHLKQGIYFIAIANEQGEYKLSKFIKE